MTPEVFQAALALARQHASEQKRRVARINVPPLTEIWQIGGLGMSGMEYFRDGKKHTHDHLIVDVGYNIHAIQEFYTFISSANQLVLVTRYNLCRPELVNITICKSNDTKEIEASYDLRQNKDLQDLSEQQVKIEKAVAELESVLLSFVHAFCNPI